MWSNRVGVRIPIIFFVFHTFDRVENHFYFLSIAIFTIFSHRKSPEFLPKYSYLYALYHLQALESSSQRTSVPLGAQDEICQKASSAIFTRGSILIALCYNTKRRALVVQIKRCTNLIAMDNNGFSDPFVKV